MCLRVDLNVHIHVLRGILRFLDGKKSFLWSGSERLVFQLTYFLNSLCPSTRYVCDKSRMLLLLLLLILCQRHFQVFAMEFQVVRKVLNFRREKCLISVWKRTNLRREKSHRSVQSPSEIRMNCFPSGDFQLDSLC